MQPLPGVKEDVETFSAIAERADEHRDGLRRVDAEHPPRVSAGTIIHRAELTGIDAVVNDFQTVGSDAVMPALGGPGQTSIFLTLVIASAQLVLTIAT